MWFWAWILNEKCITTLLFSLSSSLSMFPSQFCTLIQASMTGLFNRQNQELCRPLVILLPETSLLHLSSPSSSLLVFFFSVLPSPPPDLCLCDPFSVQQERACFICLSSLHFPHCSFCFSPHTDTSLLLT